MDFNPYKILAVDPSADSDVLAAVYRAMSKKYHPDINKAPDAEARMREINRAYDMLKDPEQRKKVDAELAREATRQGGYTPPRPASPRPGTTPRSNNPDWGAVGDQLRRQAETVINKAGSTINNMRSDVRPVTPTDRTLSFYQKQLTDETKRKNLKIVVYHDSATNRKVCNIQSSAPNARGVVTSGEVFLDAGAMFDLTLAISEAERVLEDTSSPIEMNADHDVYYRKAVPGLGHTYIAVEVIKKTRSLTKEALLLIGEKNARTEKDGVLADQSPKQFQQLGRIFQNALQSMR